MIPAKPLRLWPDKKIVTLIAAFPCRDNTALICADSQETQGDYRVTRQKIRPKQCGAFDLMFGGSGRARVIDAFARRIELVEVSFGTGGGPTLWYDDGDLFAGHSLSAHFDADGQFRGANLWG